jgi:hypothetical protein
MFTILLLPEGLDSVAFVDELLSYITLLLPVVAMIAAFMLLKKLMGSV